MAAIKIENHFQDSYKEYKMIISDLRSHLNKQSSEEVIAFVDYKTEQAMNKVWEELRHRYESVSKLDETIPDQPTKEDQQTYIRSFFKLTDPNRVINDLKKALRFNELESDYQQFIAEMSQGEYGEIFNRYQYPTSFFNGLKQGILLPIQQLTDGLRVFTEAIGQHAIILDKVKGDRTGQSIIKGGASLLGLLVGVPFAGAGVGALMGDDSQVRINHSMGNVIDGWNHYIKEFNQFLLILEDQYRLAIMALYGGTIMRVNQQLQSYRLTFDSLALLTPEYLLTIPEQEKKELEIWATNTTNGIKNLIHYQQWHEAIKVSQKFFQYVKNNPVIARTVILDQKSTIYLAHLYYYTAYQEALLEEYKNGYLDQFYEMTKQLFSELYVFIVDTDIKKLGFHSNNGLVIRFLKEAIRRDSASDALILLQYLYQINERVQTYGLYYGEHFNSLKEFIAEQKSFCLAELFLEEEFNLTLDVELNDDGENVIKLTAKQLRTMIKIDAAINQPDQLTRYLKKKYWKSFLWPWNKQSFHWVSVHKKKLGYSMIGLGLIAGIYFQGDTIYQFGGEQISKLGWFENTEAHIQVKGENTKTIIYQTTTEYANVRAQASLDSEISFVTSSTDKLTYLNEQTKDAEGRTWLYVENDQGNTGWISSKIVQISAN